VKRKIEKSALNLVTICLDLHQYCYLQISDWII